jgi:predicted GNAT family N-acyltransferase
MSRAFEIRLLEWKEALPLARPVRELVFVVEQKVPRELEWDDWDARSMHALALDASGQAIGTARLLPDGHLGRMAVLAEWRGKGVGTALARVLIEQARQLGRTEVVLNAQTHAAGFYRGLGFIERGPIFEEAGIPHQEMRLALAHPPARS